MTDRPTANADGEGDAIGEVDDIEASLAARTRRLRWLDRAVVRGPDGPAYRALTWAWLLATLARLTLLEPAHGAGWWTASLLLVASAVGLVARGGRLWWALGFLFLAWPYIGLRDWMTQSLLMMLIAGVGAATCGADRRGDAVRRTARDLAVAGYLAAAFHKLNSDFFSPQLSCAAYGWDKLVTFVGGDAATFGAPELVSGTTLAAAVVATEILIALLLVVRPRRGILLGLLFHLPLTLVLAPAFVFVMAVGYTAALGDTEFAAVGKAPRWLVAAPVAIGAASGLVFDGPAGLVLGVKCGIIATAFVAVLRLDRAGVPGGRPGRHHVAAAAVAVFVVNAATPYVGVQFQHTAAMLSNLRVDDGCWNHLLVPEPVRRVDPYLRVDQAAIGPPVEPGAARPFADREHVLTDTLWAPSALRLIRRNWCRPHTVPIRISGTVRGRAFAIDDLCDPGTPLPRGVGLLGGDEWLPDFLKLQKNLTRECPTACVH